MNRRSFVAALAGLFAWMLPKPPRKRFVQRTFPNPVRDERWWYLDIDKGPEVWSGDEAAADEWLREDMKRRTTRTELNLPPGTYVWRDGSWKPVLA